MVQALSAGAEWGAHWPKVASGMVGMSFYAMLTYHFGLFIAPLQKEFGWSREAISWGLTIYTLGAVFIGPLVGALIDKFGSRKIGIAGLLCTSISLAALSLANGSLTQWYLLWGVIAVTALGVKSTVWGAAVSTLFTTSRSLALSLVLTGSAIAQFFAPNIANVIIASKGWRAAYQVLGLGWGGLALVLVLFFFFDAHDQKRKNNAAQAPVSALVGLTVKQALRNPQILRIALANVLMALVGAGVTVHMVPILAGTGLTSGEAAAIAGLAGLAGIAGKLLTGWAMDRYQGSLIPFASFAVAAIGYSLLLNTFHSATTLAFGVAVLGFSGGAGLTVTTYLCSRYGGMRNFGKIYATIGSMMMLGTSFGPPIAGAVYDRAGSYNPLLLTAVPVMLICALLFVGLGAYPDFACDPEKPA